MLRWQFNKSALLLPQDRVWADCWPPHSRGGAWAWEEAAMWGAGRKQRGQDYYCDIISLDSFHAHHNLVHLGVQMNLFPSQLSLYTSGPAPVVAVVCCGAVVATATAAAVVRRGYNSCLLCPHSGRPRPLYCTVPHSTVLYSGYRWWSLLNISSEIRSCHRDHHKSGGWWLDRRQRIYISFIYS